MTWIRRHWEIFLPLLLIAIWSAQPLGHSAIGQGTTIFDADSALERLRVILGNQQPHPSDSDAIDGVHERLVDEIEALGFVPITRNQFHCNTIRKGYATCGQVKNILFWVSQPDDDAVMLSAHYDSVPAGPGASDDGMGVVAALEVASLIDRSSLKRPLLVMLSDGEESGLIGASAFAANDPLAERVGVVINLEARGTEGRVNLFETSSPNGPVIATLVKAGLPSSGNSLGADIYGILPYFTDLNMLLPLDIDAVNFAPTGGGVRYHTPLDNLDYLDPRTLADLGDSALVSTRAMTAVAKPVGSGHFIHGDLGGFTYFAMPLWLAFTLVVAGLAATAWLFLRSGRDARVRIALTPLFALLGGLAFAFVAAVIADILRQEAGFASAHPAVFRTVLAGAALTGATAVIAAMKVNDNYRLALASWGWLCLLVIALFMFFPGMATLVVWSAISLGLAAIAGLYSGWKAAAPWFVGLAGLLFALIALPLGVSLENALFTENSAPATFFLIWLFLFAFPFGRLRRWLPAAGSAAILIGALVAFLLVPAYSAHAPRHLNVVHEDDGEAAIVRIYNNGPLPGAMRAKAEFAPHSDDEGYWHAPAPRLKDKGVVTVRSGGEPGSPSDVTVTLTSPSGDYQTISFEDADNITGLAINSKPIPVKLPLKSVFCGGRTCRKLRLDFKLEKGTELPEFTWSTTMYGNSRWSEAIAAARPKFAVPIQIGDHHKITRKIRQDTEQQVGDKK